MPDEYPLRTPGRCRERRPSKDGCHCLSLAFIIISLARLGILGILGILGRSSAGWRPLASQESSWCIAVDFAESYLGTYTCRCTAHDLAQQVISGQGGPRVANIFVASRPIHLREASRPQSQQLIASSSSLVLCTCRRPRCLASSWFQY